MNVPVRFWVFRLTDRIEEIDGNEVARRLNDDREFAAWLCNHEAPEGALVIGDATINDELGPVVQGMCFSSIGALAVSGTRYEYSYFTSPTSLFLTASADGETIAIEGEFVPSQSFPTRELLPALYSCGERFLVLLAQLQDLGRDIAGAEIAHLQPFAAEARKALAARGYVVP